MADDRVVKIVLLADRPDAAEVLERWFVEAWPSWYGPGGPGDVRQDIADACQRDALPLCVVALDADDAVLGTAALKTDSLGSELGVGPWLAAWLVHPAHRRLGVGTALVGAIEAQATRLGFDALYITTALAAGMLRRRGWEPFGAARAPDGPIPIHRRRLVSGPP
ncbi:MAG: GNAT family N-acetyltransferase [Inquilinaceae bacterium]